jgi:hypothetical protein
VALVLVCTLCIGVVYAMAASSPGEPTMKVIIVYKSRSGSAKVLRSLAARDAKSVYTYHLIPAVAATVSRSTMEAMRRDPSVAGVFADTRIAPPRDPVGSEGTARAGRTASGAEGPIESEAVQLTHADDAWKITVNGQPVRGQGIRVGMTDTGTDPTHPDLAAAIEDYRDFTGGGLQDNDGHGTATSSCVAAQGLPVYNPETGTTMRVSGMAPAAKVLMAKVGDLNGGYDSQFIRGIEWLVDERVDIISDSWGGVAIPQDGNDPVSMVVKAAVDAGITYVVSAFNEGPGQGTLGSPSDVKGALAVGASTGNREFSQIEFLTGPDAYKSDQIISWTSRGPNSLGDFKPDVMAFGAYGWALAPMAGDAYGNTAIQEFGGTSMAAPICAGDLALAQSAWKLSHPGRQLPAPSYWKNLLASTATDLGYPALDQSSGLVNAAAAVRAVLRRGKSMLVTVGADAAQSPSSWSPRVHGGASASTTVSISNTGDAAETVSLASTAFVADASQTITRDITLEQEQDYFDAEMITIPKGTEFVEARVTWPSGPDVSIRTAWYDSEGDFLTYSPTYGGYGHLALTQVSLTGPAGQRPVIAADQPWELDIFPRASMAPTTPTQDVHLQVRFFHRATWPALKPSARRVTLRPGATAKVRMTVKAPQAAGTSFGGLVVSNGATRTTVPVSIRVPVAISAGHGAFAGAVTGSTVEYSGGEYYFYDFVVPKGTPSLAASLSWPDEGNLLNLYLVDPSGAVRDAKGGDLVSYPDYSNGSVPDSAFTHTAEQVVWNAPAPGKWQLIVWAPGFSGESFAEPFSGTVTLGASVVSPQAWTTTAVPGATVSRGFWITDPGPTALNAYAESQVLWNGEPQTQEVTVTPVTGTLAAGVDGYVATATIDVPQNVSQLTCSTSWESDPGTLIDLGLFDPTATSKAVSLATSDLGNYVVVDDPMAGTWLVTIGYGDPDVPAPTASFTLAASYVAPVPIDEFSASADADTALTIETGGEGVISASIRVPDDAQPGDVIEGVIDFYSAGDPIEFAGGDHLGSVPVTITVQ